MTVKTPCEGITKQKLVLNHIGYINPCKYNDQKNTPTHIHKILIFSSKWFTASCSPSTNNPGAGDLKIIRI